MASQSTTTRIILGLLVAALFVAAGYAIQHTVSCFLLSIVLAYLLDPFIVMMEKRKVPRSRGIILLYTLLGIFCLFFTTYLVPFISVRWEALLRDLPGYLQKTRQLVLAWKGSISSRYGGEEWSWLAYNLTGGLDSVVSRIGSGVYAATTRVVFNIFNLVLAPILVFFLLFYKDEILDGMVSWIPPERREVSRTLGSEINASIGGYIRGQIVVSLIVAVLSTISLVILRVDHPFFCGIFAGVASILPFVGVILAAIPALFFSYLQYQSGIALFKVGAAFSVIYFIEGYLIKPLVFKEAMNLNPLVTIIVVMAFGELLGFWGIILAVPLAAAWKIFFQHLRKGDFRTGDEA